MDIGRKLLTDADFANLWAVLYQELYTLSTTKNCDAALVYNSIYIICTSNSSFEEKLYWKIGDFLYNRCKTHKNEILNSNDYLKEYILQFSEYDLFVTSLNKIGCFLNESIRSRKLDDFGYLLWERVIIQNLKKGFFDDVFDYFDNERIKIIKSFEKIIPDPNHRLLYYTERYEKIAIEKIKSKYKVSHIENLFEFSEQVYKIMQYERKNMKTRFLESSYEKIENALEEAIFGSKYYELILNLADFFRFYNNSKLADFLTKNSNKDQNLPNQQDSMAFQTFKAKHCDIYTANNGAGAIKYEPLDPEKIEKLKAFIDDEFYTNKALYQNFHLINKNLELFQDPVSKPNDSSSDVFLRFLSQLGILNTGFVIIKKAYSLYIDSIIKSNVDILSSSVEQVFFLLDSLNLFKTDEFVKILNSIMKFYLQRAKPCFMRRLCNFTNSITGSAFVESNSLDRELLNNTDILSSEELSGLKPFNNEVYAKRLANLKVFLELIDLVSDKREFLNIYQNVLKSRLLNKESDLKWEYEILCLLEITEDDKLMKMVHESSVTSGKFKLLNGSCWGIEPENHLLRIPNELLVEITSEYPSLRIYQSEEKGICEVVSEEDSTILNSGLKLISGVNRSSYNEVKISMEDNKELRIDSKKQKSSCILKPGEKLSSDTPNPEVRYRIMPHEENKKIVKLAHQYSEVYLKINERTFKMNIYQYSAIDCLKSGPSTVSSISSRLFVPESLLNGVFESLLSCGIVSLADDLYFLDVKFNDDVLIDSGNPKYHHDISKIDPAPNDAPDVCIDSYLQSTCSKMLKRVGKIEISKLLSEAKAISSLDVEDDQVLNAIQKIAEKGLGEIRGEIIEYIQ